MKIAAIRKQLMTYLADADDEKVKALYTILEKELDESKPFSLSEDHIDILEERKAGYNISRSKTSNWQDVHNNIRNNRKKGL